MGYQFKRESDRAIEFNGKHDSKEPHKNHGMVRSRFDESMEVYLPIVSNKPTARLSPPLRPSMVVLAKPVLDFPHR